MLAIKPEGKVDSGKYYDFIDLSIRISVFVTQFFLIFLHNRKANWVVTSILTDNNS